MVRLVPTADLLLDADRLMVVESEGVGWAYGIYRSLVPNLTYAVTHIEVDDLPIIFEPETAIGDGHCLGLRVPSTRSVRELPWREGSHLMWFKGHAWWVEQSLTLEEATDQVSGHSTTAHHHLTRG